MTARGFLIFSSSSFTTGHLPCSSSLICANNAYARRTGIIRKMSINHCSRLGNFKLAYSVNSCLVSTLLALAVVLPSPDDTFMNVPPTLSGRYFGLLHKLLKLNYWCNISLNSVYCFDLVWAQKQEMTSGRK